ncbi:MAG: hypothetical protein AAF221_11545 [Pseudomonadota bacterium]
MRVGFMSTAIIAGLAVASCGGEESGGPVTAASSPEKIADTYVSELEKVAGALEGIESADDAEAAAKIIQEASQSLEAITEALDGEISGMKAMRIFASRGNDLMALQQRIAASMTTLAQADPEMMTRISEEMEKLPSP